MIYCARAVPGVVCLCQSLPGVHTCIRLQVSDLFYEGTEWRATQELQSGYRDGILTCGKRLYLKIQFLHFNLEKVNLRDLRHVGKECGAKQNVLFEKVLTKWTLHFTHAHKLTCFFSPNKCQCWSKTKCSTLQKLGMVISILNCEKSERLEQGDSAVWNIKFLPWTP